MKEKLVVYSGAVLAAVALIAGAHYYARASQSDLEKRRAEGVAQAASEEQRKTPVKIARVFYQSLTDTVVLPATVEAFEDIDLAAKRDGTVEWVGPKEGDRVQKDEKLAQIDVEIVQARVDQLEVANELAKAKQKRVHDLYQGGAASIDQFDEADASMKQTSAALEAARVELKHGVVTSPIDGIVDRLPIDPGEHVREGQTIMKIVDIAKVKVELDVPEKDVLYFKTGQSAEVQFSNGESHTFTGTIDFVALVADPSARTFPVKVIVENPEGLLRPGMIVRAAVTRRHLDQAIAVPFFTILDRDGERMVFVVENGVARRRVVETGFYQKGQVEIVKGLNVDDQVVVVGQRNLSDGQEVSVTSDLTDLAKEYLSQGRDPSSLALELLRQESN